MMKELEGLTYKEQLSTIGLFSLEKMSLRGNLIAVYSFLMRESREGGADLSSLVVKSSSLTGWSGTEAKSSWKWSWPQACWCS